MKALKNIHVTAKCEIEAGEKVWIATSETLSGLFIQGDTYEELCQNLKDNIPLLVHEARIPTSNDGLTIILKLVDEFTVAV